MTWTDSIYTNKVNKTEKKTFLLGTLEGEGVGVDLIKSSLTVLSALESKQNISIKVVSKALNKTRPQELSSDLIGFCQEIFEGGGAILSGAYGGRFVYEMRKEFDLFCKLVPIKAFPCLHEICRLQKKFIEDVDILLVRENSSGFYQGKERYFREKKDEGVEQVFSYRRNEVERIVKIAGDLAQNRQKKLTVVLKDGGSPEMSRLWRQVSQEIEEKLEISVSFANIDYMAYLLIQEPQNFDVIVAPNLYGDILADLGGVISGSRGLTFSGNYSAEGAAVYQTNHGAALDLSGQNRANPAGQLLSLAMLLRESFSLAEAGRILEEAIVSVWNEGWRTFDLANNGDKVVGTQEMTDLIVQKIVQ